MFSTSTLITVPALALAWLYADTLPFAYTTRIYSQVYDIKRRLLANDNKVIRKQVNQKHTLIHVYLIFIQPSFQQWQSNIAAGLMILTIIYTW